MDDELPLMSSNTSVVVFIEPLLISQASLDRVLVDRMSVDPNDSSNASILDRGQLRLTLFDYLLDCWRRLEMVKSQTSRVKVHMYNIFQCHPITKKLTLLLLFVAEYLPYTVQFTTDASYRRFLSMSLKSEYNH